MRTLLSALAISGLLLAGCGGDTAEQSAETSAPASPTAQATAASPTPAAPAKAGTQIKLGSSQFGKVLFDGTGQAIYLFDKEKSSTSQCYDACAEAWPPVLTDGAPTAAAGARADLLGTTKRTDGTTQVTYAGHPLYFYDHEGKNEVRCHDVPGFGGQWYAVVASGEPAPH